MGVTAIAASTYMYARAGFSFMVNSHNTNDYDIFYVSSYSFNYLHTLSELQAYQLGASFSVYSLSYDQTPDTLDNNSRYSRWAHFFGGYTELVAWPGVTGTANGAVIFDATSQEPICFVSFSASDASEGFYYCQDATGSPEDAVAFLVACDYTLSFSY